MGFFQLPDRQVRTPGTLVVKKGGVPDVIAAPLRRVHGYVLAGLILLLAVAITLQTPSQRRQVVDFQRCWPALESADGGSPSGSVR